MITKSTTVHPDGTVTRTTTDAAAELDAWLERVNDPTTGEHAAYLEDVQARLAALRAFRFDFSSLIAA